jgi:hypothetical protein
MSTSLCPTILRLLVIVANAEQQEEEKGIIDNVQDLLQAFTNPEPFDATQAPWSQPDAGPILLQRATELWRAALASGTLASYKSGVAKYRAYVLELHITNPFPPSEQVLIGFVAFCSFNQPRTNKPLAPSTVSKYLTAVHALCLDMGLRSLVESSILLRKVLRGYKKKYGVPRKLKIPITPELLLLLAKYFDMSYHDQAMCFWAACVAVYLLLRKSEFLQVKDNQEVPLTRLRWMQVDEDRGLVVIVKSKVDVFKQGATLQLFRLGGDTCPYQAVSKALEAGPDKSPSAPLFQRSDGSPLTQAFFNSVVKQALQALEVELGTTFRAQGYDEVNFSTRRGGATAMSASGARDSLIQVAGRWASNAFRLYLDTSRELLKAADVSSGRQALIAKVKGMRHMQYDPDSQATNSVDPEQLNSSQ